jgi:hypothetical protein
MEKHIKDGSLLTAEDILKAKETYDEEYPTVSISDATEAMIEFAKLHVEAALKTAAGNVEADLEPMGWLAEQHLNSPLIIGEDYEIGISRNSILNSYPLENIK